MEHKFIIGLGTTPYLIVEEDPHVRVVRWFDEKRKKNWVMKTEKFG